MLGLRAIASLSLGFPPDQFLAQKLRAAAGYGFDGIEMYFDDLKSYAKASNITLFTAAHNISALCDILCLQVICLQPFLFYEGLRDRAEHARKLNEQLPLWFEIAALLKTDLILVPSNFLGPDPIDHEPRTTGDLDVILGDLRELADNGLQRNPPIRFAYESIAWANHVNTWEAGWEIVCQVNRPNFGICLDTFNIAARVYADPAVPSGVIANADACLCSSLERLRSTVDPEKIFLLQIADGERLSSPLVEGHQFYVPGQPSLMTWSRNARLFPLEHDQGAYLPITEIICAVVDVGFVGPISIEVYSRTLANKSWETPEKHARRAIKSWFKLKKACAMLRQNKKSLE